MKERILEANVQAIKVVKEIQRTIDKDYGIELPFDYLLESLLHLTADIFIIAMKK